MLSRFPGVLIGRLAVSKKYKHQGVGSQVLKFLKFWFAENDDKSACRFLIVDAKNEPNVLSFYERNGFFLNAYYYIQPALSEEGKELTLLLMTRPVKLPGAEFVRVRETLYRQVYGCPEG